MIHTTKDYSIVNEAEVDFFLEFLCFLHDPMIVDNLISVSSVSLKPRCTSGIYKLAYCWSLSSVQLLYCVQLFAMPWITAHQDSLSIINSGVYSNSYRSSWWCHPTISSSLDPSSPAYSLSEHQGLFQWITSSHQVAKVLEFQLQPQSFQWIFRTDFL